MIGGFYNNFMMQISAEQIREIQTLLDGAKEVLIALPKSPNLDKVATALSLFLALSSKGKQVKAVCSNPMTVEFNQLVGVDKITSVVNGGNGRNLIISFPYQEGSIEKVSYNIENNTFNLVIEPREGYPMITPDVIRYCFGGGNIDLIITIGAASLTDLDSIYQAGQDLFSSKPIVNIDSQNHNQRFGKINIIDPNISSVSELVLYLFSQLNFQIDPDIATNLLSGITSGSQNFTSKETSITTFEAASMCLRNGAKRGFAPSYFQQIQREPQQRLVRPKPAYPPPYASTMSTPQSFSKPSINIKMPQTKSKLPAEPQLQQPFQQQVNQPQQKPPQTPEAPPDWLKPKIYKGSTLL